MLGLSGLPQSEPPFARRKSGDTPDEHDDDDDDDDGDDDGDDDEDDDDDGEDGDVVSGHRVGVQHAVRNRDMV